MSHDEHGTEHDRPAGPKIMSKGQRWFVSWTTDVLIYVVVLNLFVEFWDEITIDSFAISLLTAVLLKVILDIVIRVEHGTSGFFDRFEGSLGHWLGLVATVVVLIAGKFAILLTVEAVFGDEVDLGHVLSVTVLVIGLIAGSFVMHWIYDVLGPDRLEDTIVIPAG